MVETPSSYSRMKNWCTKETVTERIPVNLANLNTAAISASTWPAATLANNRKPRLMERNAMLRDSRKIPARNTAMEEEGIEKPLKDLDKKRVEWKISITLRTNTENRITETMSAM